VQDLKTNKVDWRISVKFVPVIVNGQIVPGYFVNKSGIIVSKKRNKTTILTSRVDSTRRYPYVTLSINGKGRMTMVHRIVCESFIKHPKSYPGISATDWKTTPNSVKEVLRKNMQVNHKNGNILDHNLRNLEWITAEENINHYYETRVRCKK